MAVSIRVVLAVALSTLLFTTAWPAAGADLQWAPLAPLPATSAVFSVANDPASPNSAYAATMGSGLLRTDDGKSWHDVGGAVLPTRLWRVAIDPAKGPSGSPPIYVGSAGSGIFRSLDGAKTWENISKSLPRTALNVRSMALGRGLILIATSDGVYKTIDAGKSWQPMGLQGFDVSSVAFAKYNPPLIILAGIDGVKTPGSRLLGAQDLSGSWLALKQGVPSDLVVSAIAAGPVHQQDNLRTVFVAGSGGVYKSDDNGQSWAQLAGLPAQGFGSLALSPADPNILYTASDGGGGATGGVWRTTDRGGTWTQVSGGLTEKAITALSVGRNNPASLFAVAWNPDKPAVVPFALSDTQAQPQGEPEGGMCPEGNSGCPPLAESSPGVVSSFPLILPEPCQSPIIAIQQTSPSPSGSSSPTALPTPSPSTSASPSPSPSPTCAPSPASSPSHHNDLPAALALLVLGAVLLALVVRVVLVRRRAQTPTPPASASDPPTDPPGGGKSS
jgi:photosystem II stability/assembly factor-like uncharacterized protein